MSKFPSAHDTSTFLWPAGGVKWLPQGQQFQGCETSPGLDFTGTQDLIGYVNANSAAECCRKCYDDETCSAPVSLLRALLPQEIGLVWALTASLGTCAAHFSWWSAGDPNNRHALHLTLHHLTLAVQRNTLDYCSSCCAPFCVISDLSLPSDILLESGF